VVVVAALVGGVRHQPEDRQECWGIALPAAAITMFAIGGRLPVKSDQLFLLIDRSLAGVDLPFHGFDPDPQALAALVQLVICIAVRNRPAEHQNGKNSHEYSVAGLIFGHLALLFFYVVDLRFKGV
jgi:hypothetical protein